MTFTIEPMINAGKAAISRACRWLDHRHQGSQPVRPVGAHHPRYRTGRRGANDFSGHAAAPGHHEISPMHGSLALETMDARALTAEFKPALQDGHQRILGAYETRPDPAELLLGRSQLIDRTLRSIWERSALPPDVGAGRRGRVRPWRTVSLLRRRPFVSATALGLARHGSPPRIPDRSDLGHRARYRSQRAHRRRMRCARPHATSPFRPTFSRHAFSPGSRELFDRFAARLHDDLDPQAFFKAKRLEQEERLHPLQRNALQPRTQLQGEPGRPARPANHSLDQSRRRHRQHLERPRATPAHHPRRGAATASGRDLPAATCAFACTTLPVGARIGCSSTIRRLWRANSASSATTARACQRSADAGYYRIRQAGDAAQHDSAAEPRRAP